MLGRKTGGRQRGSPNKKTAARKAQEAAIAAEIEDARSRGLEPLDYMLGVMRDVTADVTRRKAAAPYRHSQLSSVKHDGVVDHAIRIVWAGMPAISGGGARAPQIESKPVAALPGPQPQIEHAEAVPALPSPEAEAGDHCGASA